MPEPTMDEQPSEQTCETTSLTCPGCGFSADEGADFARHECEDVPYPQPSEPERCMAVQGTAMSGPMYCGYRTTEVDKNGRPCCKRHLDKQLGIEWRGVNGDYPYGSGTYRHWTFKHGEFR